MKNQHKWKYWVLICLFSYVFFFHGIGSYSLKEPDEGRYAEIPREMNELHDYTVPHLNYVRYFEKPPMLYWTNALSYKLFGTNEWALRFPNALAALLCVFFLYFFVRRWFNEEMAFISSLILISSIGFFAMARIVTTDMLFTMWLCLSLLFFYAFYREKKGSFIYLFYAFTAAASLTKGPVALILLGGTILIFLFTERRLSFIKEMKPLRGLAVYLVITLPWIIAISLRERDFLYFFFMDQHVLRFLTSKHKRSGPMYYFLPVLFAGLFPWSVFIPRALVLGWQQKALRLFFIWSCVVFVFFSVSGSKLPPYILPLFPTMAIILAYFFHDRWRAQASRWAEVSIYGIIFCVFAAIPLLSKIAFFKTYLEDLSGESALIVKDLYLFSLAISLYCLIVLITLFFKHFRQYSRVFVSLAGFSLVLMAGILFSLNVVDRLNTAKGLALMINNEKPRADYIVNYSSYDQTLPFYLKRGIILASYKGELAMGSEYDDAKNIFIEDEEFLRLLSSGKRVLFVTKEKRIKRLKELLPGRIRILDCQNDRCLVSNY